MNIRDNNVTHTAEVNVSGLAGFLLAKTAAAFSRRKAKDWYDIAFVLLHNDAGGTDAAAALVERRFTGEITALRTALVDLEANFENPVAQGAQAYVTQMLIDHPDLNPRTPGRRRHRRSRGILSASTEFFRLTNTIGGKHRRTPGWSDPRLRKFA